ncbi:hypothetical protein SAMN04489732_102433 [Amycolatopsis saalfeldensis]|uniref:Uncharacterized protein n=1 Tax=Amycolatopsis saalfeldensis TaxID=394193 RepID=A0A1H8T505_9PSEU|nr:hypothetical protein SAMN04489732_102433 [Amycolatopsis saalfeldensis]
MAHWQGSEPQQGVPRRASFWLAVTATIVAVGFALLLLPGPRWYDWLTVAALVLVATGWWIAWFRAGRPR